MSTDDSMLAEQDCSPVHVYIREDIKRSQRVNLDVFVDTLFGLTKERMSEWVAIIGKGKWHQDEELSRALVAFCADPDETDETSRYEPLSDIANRVVRMAHGRLPDVPDTYPIDNICVKRNSPNCIQPVKTHGKPGAHRAPNCLLLRGRNACHEVVPPPLPRSVQDEISASTDALATPGTTDIAPHASTSRRIGRGKTPVSAVNNGGTRRMARRASTRKTAAPENNLANDSHGGDLMEHGGEPRPVRWVDVIMSVEIKGKASLSRLLNSFLKDRNQVSNPTTEAEVRRGRRGHGGHGGRDGRGNRGRPQGKGRGIASVTPPVAKPGMDNMSSTTPSGTGSRKRQREDDDDDDLLCHIRRSNPPACTLDSLFSDSETPEKLSYEIKQAAIQTASYALETLACTFGTRLFCVNILIKNDRVYFWYYDACGFVYTESISVVEDFEKFAAILVAIACSSPAQLGALPSFIQPPQHAPYPANWPPENLQDHTLTIPRTISVAGVETTEDVQITLQDSVFSHYVLAGRRTFVYAIKTSTKISDDELIAKFSYQVNTRRQEHELINIARTAGVGHLPTVHAWGEHWKMSDGVRSIFYAKAGAEFEDRTLRSMVYTKYLPLETLFSHSPQQIPNMAYQLFDCLHDLRYKANMLHRDISVNNVMYEYRDSRIYFILIDFDMATVLAEDYVPNSKHRTGTLAFMAVDLIRDAVALDNPDHHPIPHLLCHDLESIFWLCLWCAMVFVVVHDAEQRRKLLDAVRGWETQEPLMIAHYKRSLRNEPLDIAQICLPQAAIDVKLDLWFWRWARIWMEYDQVTNHWLLDCRVAKKAGEPGPDSFDHETAGGVITRDYLRERLTQVVPDNYENAEPLRAPVAETPVLPGAA